MKLKTGLAVVLTAASMTTSAALVEFQFNEASGTTLSQSLNSGTISGSFTSDIDGITQDGAGSLDLNPTVSGTGSQIEGLGLSSGTITLEYRIDSWDMNAATNGAGFQLGMKNLAGDSIKSTFIRKNSGMRAQFVDKDSLKTNAGDFAFASGADGLLLRIEADLNAGTFSAAWKLDSDTDWTTALSGSSGLTDVNVVNIWIPAGNDWNSGSASIDQLTVIPEPTTIGLIASSSVGILIARRRLVM